MEDVNKLLHASTGGDRNVLDGLIPIVYRELRRLAHNYLSEQSGHSLPTTALVHKAYFCLVDCKRIRWQNRAARSRQSTRRILVENARHPNLKPGGGLKHIPLDEAAVVGGDRSPHPMRYVEGRRMEATAEGLNVARITVRRAWSAATIWLYRGPAGGTDGLSALEAGR